MINLWRQEYYLKCTQIFLKNDGESIEIMIAEQAKHCLTDTLYHIKAW